MVKKENRKCRYTQERECPFLRDISDELYTAFKLFCGRTYWCSECIVKDAFESGIVYEMTREERKQEMQKLKDELKRPNLSEKERAEVLKKMTDFIRQQYR